jgi:hypothetical protein
MGTNGRQEEIRGKGKQRRSKGRRMKNRIR